MTSGFAVRSPSFDDVLDIKDGDSGAAEDELSSINTYQHDIVLNGNNVLGFINPDITETLRLHYVFLTVACDEEAPIDAFEVVAMANGTAYNLGDHIDIGERDIDPILSLGQSESPLGPGDLNIYAVILDYYRFDARSTVKLIDSVAVKAIKDSEVVATKTYDLSKITLVPAPFIRAKESADGAAFDLLVPQLPHGTAVSNDFTTVAHDFANGHTISGEYPFGSTIINEFVCYEGLCMDGASISMTYEVSGLSPYHSTGVTLDDFTFDSERNIYTKPIEILADDSHGHCVGVFPGFAEYTNSVLVITATSGNVSGSTSYKLEIMGTQ